MRLLAGVDAVGLFELLFSPEISGGQDGNDFKVDQVFPAANPSVQQLRVRRFHELETASARRVDPARVVSDAFGQHSATQLESFANKPGIAVFEAFQDHKEHAAKCTPEKTQMTGVRVAERAPVTGKLGCVRTGKRRREDARTRRYRVCSS